MNRFKKCMSVICTMTIALTMLGGCGKKDNTNNENSDTFEPSMDTSASAVIDVQGSWSNFEALEAVAADWNEIYPNVTISYSKVDGYQQQLDTIVSGVNPPEMVMYDTNTYYDNAEDIVDKFLDISDIGLNLDIYDDSIIDEAMVADKLCIFNWAIRVPGFVVNKQILDECGLSVPETAEEFDEVCAKLKENGYTPIQGCNDSIYTYILKNAGDYQLATVDNADKIYDDFYNNSLNSGEVFDGEFETMLELVDKGYVDIDVNSEIPDIYEGSILHFFEGNTPFLCFTTEGVSGMKKRESMSENYVANPFEYEFDVLPVGTQSAVFGVESFGGLAIVEGSKDVEWAKEFMRFLCCEDEINKMAEVKGVPSAIDEDYMQRGFKKKDNVLDAYIEEAFSYTLYTIADGEVKDVETAENVFGEKLKALLDEFY